jgi:hypothetical protein
MAIGGGARCTGGPCRGQRRRQWQQHWTTVDDDDDENDDAAAVAVDDHGGAPPSLLPSLLADALASLYFPALSVEFGLPLLTSSRSNTVMTVDAPSFSNRLPRGGHIQHHCRDGSNRDDVGININGREVGRRGADQYCHCHHQGNDEMTPTTMMMISMMMTTMTMTMMMVHCRPGFLPLLGGGRRVRLSWKCRQHVADVSICC